MSQGTGAKDGAAVELRAAAARGASARVAMVRAHAARSSAARSPHMAHRLVLGAKMR